LIDLLSFGDLLNRSVFIVESYERNPRQTFKFDNTRQMLFFSNFSVKICKVYQYLNSYKFQEEKDCWLWKKPPPLSKKPVNIVDPIDGVKIEDVSSEEKNMSFKINDRLLKGIRSLVIISNLVYFFLD